MEANREEAEFVLEKAREAMRTEPHGERPMALLRKAERMHASDEVRKAITDWQAIVDVFALRHDARALLGASVNMSEAELGAARRKLALRVHPDKNSAPQAAEAFQIVQSAFEQTKAALVGGVLPPPAAPPQPQWPAAAAAAAPSAACTQVQCAFCSGLLNVQVPQTALRSAAGAARVLHDAFDARCCHCSNLMRVPATSDHDTFAAWGQGGAWAGAQPSLPHAPRPAGGAGGKARGRAPDLGRAGAARKPGGGPGRPTAPARAHFFGAEPPAGRSEEQKAAERKANRQRARELQAAEAELRQAAKLANERARAEGGAGAGRSAAGSSRPGVGAQPFRSFVDLDEEPLEPEAAAAAEAAEAAERARAAAERKRKRAEERERTKRRVQAQQACARPLSELGSGEARAPPPVVIDLDASDAEDARARAADCGAQQPCAEGGERPAAPQQPPSKQPAPRSQTPEQAASRPPTPQQPLPQSSAPQQSAPQPPAPHQPEPSPPPLEPTHERTLGSGDDVGAPPSALGGCAAHRLASAPLAKPILVEAVLALDGDDATEEASQDAEPRERPQAAHAEAEGGLQPPARPQPPPTEPMHVEAI